MYNITMRMRAALLLLHVQNILTVLYSVHCTVYCILQASYINIITIFLLLLSLIPYLFHIYLIPYPSYLIPISDFIVPHLSVLIPLLLSLINQKPIVPSVGIKIACTYTVQ